MQVLDRVDEARITELRQRGDFFWLDLVAPPAEEIQKAGRTFGWHELAIEDTLHFGQRPKLDEYGSYVLLVFYGVEHAEEESQPVEVHIYISGECIVTVRQGGCLHLEDVKKRLIDHAASEPTKVLDLFAQRYRGHVGKHVFAAQIAGLVEHCARALQNPSAMAMSAR